MRTQLNGFYNNGSFELRRTEDGSLHLTVEPNQVLRIGNSIGGFWAKPIRYAGEPMLALVRIGGSAVGWSAEQLRRQFGGERGTILRPGPGLWAVSSGAARRGVWHPIREDADPIRSALRSLRFPSTLVRTVDGIDETVYEGGNLCKHSTHGGSNGFFFTDGDASEVLEHATFVRSHGNQYHVGCQETPTRRRVKGGTYLIVGADVSRDGISGMYPAIHAVVITPKVDKEFVARMVRAAGSYRRDRHEAVEAVEVEQGLRCPVCKREDCNLALHQAEEVAKAAQEKAARDLTQTVRETDGVKYRILAEEKFGRRWSYGAKALERVSDGTAFVCAGWTGIKPASEYNAPTVIDQESGLTWEAAEGIWQVQRSKYPAIC